MRIGELARRTGASRRSLRYYEEQGLISSARTVNGYRAYDPRVVDRVLQVRGLLEAALPVRIIKAILPCLDTPGVLVCETEASEQVLSALRHEREALQVRAEALSKNAAAIDRYLRQVEAPSSAA